MRCLVALQMYLQHCYLDSISIVNNNIVIDYLSPFFLKNKNNVAIRSGLHGYNGVLVGCAAAAFDATAAAQVI